MKKLTLTIAIPLLILSSASFAQSHDNRYEHNDYKNDRGDRNYDRNDRNNRFDRDDHHGPDRNFRNRHYNGWQGNFHHNDENRWRQGKWVKGNHQGQNGWWWVAGNSWYLYTRPVYPYPAMSVPPVIYRYNTTALATTRYYCSSTDSYYPYVSTCRVPWQSVVSY